MAPARRRSTASSASRRTGQSPSRATERRRPEEWRRSSGGRERAASHTSRCRRPALARGRRGQVGSACGPPLVSWQRYQRRRRASSPSRERLPAAVTPWGSRARGSGVPPSAGRALSLALGKRGYPGAAGTRCGRASPDGTSAAQAGCPTQPWSHGGWRNAASRLGGDGGGSSPCTQDCQSDLIRRACRRRFAIGSPGRAAGSDPLRRRAPAAGKPVSPTSPGSSGAGRGCRAT